MTLLDGYMLSSRVRCRIACATTLLVMFVMGIGSAAADVIYCQGTVTTVYIDSYGAVIFQPSYRADYTQVCNVHGTWQGVSSETCFAWFSALLSAKVHNKQVLLQYSTATAYTCANLPTYAGSPQPSYVMVTS